MTPNIENRRILKGGIIFPDDRGVETQHRVI
jgi:hypothetical protein